MHAVFSIPQNYNPTSTTTYSLVALNISL